VRAPASGRGPVADPRDLMVGPGRRGRCAPHLARLSRQLAVAVIESLL
jgi:hypothetical protein